MRGSGFGVEGDDDCVAQDRSATATLSRHVYYLFNFDVQQRRNPKVKSANVFEINPGVDPEAVVDQNDTRDGTDYAFNGEVAQKLGDGLLRLYGFYVYTDREETEFTQTFDSDAFFNRDGLSRLKIKLKIFNSRT